MALIYIKVHCWSPSHYFQKMACRMAKAPTSGDREWQPINAAPFDRDLELAVINYHGTHALVFPCRRILGGWIKAETKERIDVQPTHWREWMQP